MAERGILDGVLNALGIPSGGESGVMWKPKAGARGIVGNRFAEEAYYNEISGITPEKPRATTDVKTVPQGRKKSN